MAVSARSLSTRISRKLSLGLVLGLLLATGACDSGPTVEIKGWVYGDGPLSGATVTVLDFDGEEIAIATAQTSAHGAFTVEAKDLPASFRIVASGGESNGQLFAGDLASRVSEFDPEGYVTVSLLTTAVDSYLEGTPGLAFDHAVGQIRSLLEIPTYADITSDAYIEGGFFSSREMLAEAQRAGGLPTIMEGLVRAAQHGEPLARAFAPHPTNSAAGSGSTAAKEGDSAVGGAIQGYVVEYALDEALTRLGVIEEPDAATLKLLGEIKRQLSALSDQITDVEANLSALILTGDW